MGEDIGRDGGEGGEGGGWWGGVVIFLANSEFYSPPLHPTPWRLPSLPNDTSCHGNPKHDPTDITGQAHIGKLNEFEALYDFASAGTTKKVP